LIWPGPRGIAFDRPLQRTLNRRPIDDRRPMRRLCKAFDCSWVTGNNPPEDCVLMTGKSVGMRAVRCRSSGQRLPITVHPLRAVSNPAGNSNHLCRFGVYLANFGSGGVGRIVMFRNVAFVAIYVTALVLLTAGSTRAAQYGTEEEAKAMLDRAVAAVKEDKAKALDMFNKGEDGFKDRDLYVFCANASDGIVTAHPYGNKGKQLREILGKKGYPLGQEMMQ